MVSQLASYLDDAPSPSGRSGANDGLVDTNEALIERIASQLSGMVERDGGEMEGRCEAAKTGRGHAGLDSVTARRLAAAAQLRRAAR